MKIGRLNRASFAKTARRVMLLFAFAALGAQAATVATVNGTGYETLEAAIAAAEPRSTVAVCEDIQQDKTLTIEGKDLTLDLNGKTLTVATEGDGIVVQNATLNLSNSGGTGKYVFECTASRSDGIFLHNTREDGGTILNINSNVEILFKPGVNSAIHAYGEAGTAVVNMNAGNVYAKGEGQRVSAVIIDQNAAFNMKGGTFNLNVDFDAFSQNNDVVGVLVWGQNGVQKNGTVKIEGGSFNVGGKNAFAQIVQVGMKNVKSDNVSVEISGGEIVLSPSEDGKGYVFTPYNAAYASATMSGGRIRGTVTALTATASGADKANMVVSGGTFPFEVKESYCADGFTVKATTDADGNTVYGVVKAAFVTVTGIAGFADRKFASFAEAYTAIKPTIAGLGLEQESATADAFDALFTSVDANGNATLTYTISGAVVYDETDCANLLTMGRKASHYGNGRHLINFKFVGATGKEADTLTVKSNITLPYEWWGEKTTTGIHFENLTITGSAPNGLYPSQPFFEGIDFSVSNCALKGIKIYNCSNVKGSYTITDSVLDGTGAPAKSYAIHLQGNETAPLSINIRGNTISGYDRGINIDQKTAVATIEGNTISVKDAGRSCIQLSSLATAGIVGNTLELTGGNAITLHANLLTLSAAPEVSISGNTVTGTGYLVYDDAMANGTAFTSGTLKLTYATDNVVAATVNTTQGVKGSTEYALSETVATTLHSVDFAAFVDALTLTDEGYTFDGSKHARAQNGKLTVKWSPVSGCYDKRGEGHDCTVGNVIATANTPKRVNSGLTQFQLFEGESHAVNVKNVAFVYEPAAFTVCENSDWRGSFTAEKAPAGQIYLMNTGDVTFEDCSFDKVVLTSFNCTGTSTVKDCSFKNVYNSYAVKDIRGATVAVTGCTFENCGAAVMVSSTVKVGAVTIRGNTFTKVDVAGTAPEGKVGTRGLVQIASSGDYADTAFDFSGNTATGCGPVLRQLNSTVSFDADDKTDLGNLVSDGGASTFYTDDTFVAQVGDTKYATLAEAFAALSAGNHTLALLKNAAWDAATPVYWAAGAQSGYAATLTAALTAAYKANASAITIVCRPGADVGTMTHGHVADDLTIYGNNAYLSGGECDLEVDQYKYSRATGAQATDGVYLDKNITITAYELDNLGVWGERHTSYTVTVNLTDCDGKALEGKTNVQRVYISGTTGVNNITLTGCDFLTEATAVYSNANGAIKAVNCSFTGGQVPFNINHKANGTQTVAVENCRFTNCGDAGGWKQFAAPLRLVNSGAGTLSAEVKGCAFTDTVGANGDILLGDGRTGETSNDVALKVTDTAANIQAQKPGYYVGETVDATKKATATSPAEGTLETSVAQLLPVDPRTLGYATSGKAEALPETPNMNGEVVNVTAAQAQYVLDGAYGPIDGKTINFTESINDTLILGRASKYDGSKTVYRHGSHTGEALSYAEFIAYKNQSVWTESCYYERTIENVTFTANKGVTVKNFEADGGAHIYAGAGTAPVYDYVRDMGSWVTAGSCYFKRAILNNITFKGLTFTAKTDINTSESKTVYDGFTFKNCTFDLGSTADGNQAIRYYNENNNGNVKNLVVDGCRFQNCSQGVYTMHVNGITVKDSTFTQTGHNAIAIQSQGGDKGPCNHGAVVITGNKMVNIGDRAIRFGVVAAGTTITITGNTATYKKDGTAATEKQCIKATTLEEGVTTTVELNNWNNYAVAANKPLMETVAKIGTTDYKSLEDATEAAQDGDIITIVGYTSNMTAPDGWKFETVDGVTTLVADPVLVKGVDGKFHIASYDDLLLFKKMVNEKGMNFSGETVVLDANISMASVENWTPVGNASEKKFAGTFDGQNHTISGLKITGGSYVGLFGYLGAATVQNVALVGANVSGVKRVGALVGQIAGNATIKNCSLDTTSSVTGSDSNTGGLIGEASGSIVVTLENLTNNAPVTNTESGMSRAAGILCQATSGASVTLKNCVNNGTITTNGGYAGGIVSAKQGGASLVFDGCSNTGTLANGTKGTGALLAWSCNGSSVTISNYSGDVANAIGWLSQDNYDHVFVINGVEHYIRVAKGGSGYTFASRYEAARLMNKSYLQEIIGFFNYAKTVNANFEGYPETPVEVLKSAYSTSDGSIKGGLFNTDVSSGWPQLLSQYNATSGKSLTADDFAVTWGTRDVLFMVGDAVAKIGNSYYATLAEAVAAATAGQTITLISDVANAGNVSLKAGVTLDGYGHKVTGNSAVYINKAGGTVQNVVFKDIHNAANNLSAVYASGLAGTATITGCTFDNCDWDAIQATPVAGAVLTITGNVFDTDNTDSVQQQRYVHIQSAVNVDFTATVTGNVMTGDTKQGALEAYYFADEEKIDVSHNYIEDKADVCILDGTGALRNDMVFPAYKDAEKTELYQPVAMIATSAYSADYYPTVAAALIGAKSGDTIQILAGTWGADAIGKLDEEGKYTNANIVRYKSLTIQPAKGAKVTFTSTLSLGYDDSSTANATMTVKDLTFDGASLKIANYVQTTVEGCTFVNGANSAANGTLTIIDSCCTSHKTADAYPVSQVTVKDCSIDGSAAGSPGIRIRNSGNVTITGNVINNTAHNGILFESNGSVDNTPVKTVSITGNAITEWDVGNVAGGGRAMRLDFGTLAAGSTVTVEENVFRKETTGLDTPDFIKITGAAAATVSLEDNDWNNELRSTVSGNSDYYTVDTATPVALAAVVTTKKVAHVVAITLGDETKEMPFPITWLAAYIGPYESSWTTAALDAKAENGLAKWQCYLFGLDPTKADAKVVATAGQGTEKSIPLAVTNADASPLVTGGYVTVAYVLMGSNDRTTWTQVAASNTQDGLAIPLTGTTYKFYRVDVTVTSAKGN